jgi:predicted GIY-YIG superfamily endonuclease
MTGNYYVYIMNNQANTVLYTGMTNDLRRRVFEHKSGKGAGFTVKYKTKKFVFYERFDKAVEAISAENGRIYTMKSTVVIASSRYAGTRNDSRPDRS